MIYVLDASVAIKWVLPEVDSAKAVLLRDEYRRGTHRLIAPDVFVPEIAHGLTKAERRGALPVGMAESLVVSMLNHLPGLHSSLPLVQRAVQIASHARIAAYDCFYVALAEREGCELVTADQRVVNSLQSLFAFIKPLSSI
jgi:predicted nucleic acid-binding protein